MQLFRTAGLEKQKLEMRYDTFAKKTTLLEDLRLNRWVSLSGRIDSATVRTYMLRCCCRVSGYLRAPCKAHLRAFTA